jgi:nicotinate phosphoribosyltransferase
MGYKPKGIRLDSGDLAYLSKMARKQFLDCSKMYNIAEFERFIIVASNSINEAVLIALRDQKHEIDAFGIGTKLVTCQKQPALGMVFKLVEVDDMPRIKLSQEIEKVTIPGKKEVFRLIGKDGTCLLDLIIRQGDDTEIAPGSKSRILCRHPFDGKRRAYVTPQKVLPLLELMWDGEKGGLLRPHPTLDESRSYVKDQLKLIREDVLRCINPTPYKVSVSPNLYDYMHNLWLKETPVADLS